MNIYLSRLSLDPRSRRVIRELAQPYEMHRTLMQAFPEADKSIVAGARGQFGILFRAEVDEAFTVSTVLIQSTHLPDWSRLPADNYLLTGDPGRDISCKDILPAISAICAGQTLRFRLRANPSKRVGAAGDPLKGKRVALYGEDAQMNWLATQGARAGFQPLSVRIGNVNEARSRKPNHQMTHFGVTFDGTLRVTDAEAIREALQGGIGPAKAFGFGLLSLAPL